MKIELGALKIPGHNNNEAAEQQKVPGDSEKNRRGEEEGATGKKDGASFLSCNHRGVISKKRAPVPSTT